MNANSTKRISMKNLLPSDTESHILSVPHPRQCAPFSFRGSSPRSRARLWLWLRLSVRPSSTFPDCSLHVSVSAHG